MQEIQRRPTGHICDRGGHFMHLHLSIHHCTVLCTVGSARLCVARQDSRCDRSSSSIGSRPGAQTRGLTSVYGTPRDLDIRFCSVTLLSFQQLSHPVLARLASPHLPFPQSQIFRYPKPEAAPRCAFMRPLGADVYRTSEPCFFLTCCFRASTCGFDGHDSINLGNVSTVAERRLSIAESQSLWMARPTLPASCGFTAFFNVGIR